MWRSILILAILFTGWPSLVWANPTEKDKKIREVLGLLGKSQVFQLQGIKLGDLERLEKAKYLESLFKPLSVGLTEGANKIALVDSNLMLTVATSDNLPIKTVVEKLGKEDRKEMKGFKLELNPSQHLYIDEWYTYDWIDFGVSKEKVVAVRVKCGRVPVFGKVPVLEEAKAPPPPKNTKEDKAAAAFKKAEEALAGGSPALARIRCQAILREFPETLAAQQAKKLLEKLMK